MTKTEFFGATQDALDILFNAQLAAHQAFPPKSKDINPIKHQLINQFIRNTGHAAGHLATSIIKKERERD